MRLGARRILSRTGDKAPLAQGSLPFGFPLGISGLGTRFIHALPRGSHLSHRQRALRLLIVVPQLHQQLALLDPVAFLHRQNLDAPTHDRRQFGALAGFDRTGARVGDTRLDLPALNLADDHDNRLRPAEPPEGGSDDGDDNGQSNQNTANRRGHGGKKRLTACAIKDVMVGQNRLAGKGSPRLCEMQARQFAPTCMVLDTSWTQLQCLGWHSGEGCES